MAAKTTTAERSPGNKQISASFNKDLVEQFSAICESENISMAKAIALFAERVVNGSVPRKELHSKVRESDNEEINQLKIQLLEAKLALAEKKNNG